MALAEVILIVGDEDVAVQVRFEYLAEDGVQVDTVALGMEQVGEVWLVSGVRPVAD